MSPPRTSRSSLRRYGILAAAIIAIATAGYFWSRHAAADAGGGYRTEAVQRGDIRVAISATGTLSATSTVTVGSQISGQVTEVLADFNSPVKKGDVLAKIDPSTYQAQLEQGEAQIASARAQLEQARANLANAQADYARKADLGRRQLVSKSDVDLARAALGQAQGQVAAASAQIRQQSASLKNTEVSIGRAVIRSPVDGVVLTRKIEPGQTVAANFSAPELFTIAEDLSKMKIELAVDESDIGQVKVGQAVSFTADAFPDRKFKGLVEQVRLAATTDNNVVTYPVVVTVDNSDGTLLPGLTVNAEIEVSKREGVLKVANAALRYKPADDAIPAMPLGGGRQQRSQQPAGQRGGLTDDLARVAAGMRLDPAQQATFDAAVAAIRQRQQSRQTGSQGGGFGPGMMMMGGNANIEAIQAQMRQRMAERFRQDFSAFRASLDDARKRQWDEALSGLVNAKRVTLYKLVDGRPQPVMVRLGASDGTATEIAGSDVKAGDEMIVGERAPAGGK